jgi:hypothetical protein
MFLCKLPRVAPIHHVRNILTKPAAELRIMPPIQSLSSNTCAAWAVLIVALNFDRRFLEPHYHTSRLEFYDTNSHSMVEENTEEEGADATIILG